MMIVNSGITGLFANSESKEDNLLLLFPCLNDY
jgi:hypothetical protein